MSFSAELLKEGEGFVWLLEVSNDNFATIAYRWATVACHVDSDRYDARIVKLGKLQKAFGLDSLPTVSTVSLILDNSAFDMDWLVDVDQGAIEFTYRFRLSLGLYSLPMTTPGKLDSANVQVMGTFGMLDSPSRDSVSVTLQLADDSMGRFNEIASSPTITEWVADSGTTDDNCLLHGWTNPNKMVSWETPLPLVFGPSAIGRWAAVGGGSSDNAGTLEAAGYSHAIIVCVTTSTDSVAANDVTNLVAAYRDDTMLRDGKWAEGAGALFGIPSSFTIQADDVGVKANRATAGTFNIWAAQKTQGITKDGHTWKVLWIAFSSAYYYQWALRNLPGAGYVGGQVLPDGTQTPFNESVPFWGGNGAVNSNSPDDALLAIEHFVISGYPFSAQTVKTTPYPTGVNVIRDLISYYSAGSSSDIDSTSFDTALAANPTRVGGGLQPLQVDSTLPSSRYLSPVAAAIVPGQLRQTIGDIARSIQLDVFFTWAGKLGVSAGWFDFTSITAARVAIDETRCNNVKERKPSQGERWSFYNRVFVIGAGGQVAGPFDYAASVTAIGIKVPRTIQGRWLLPDTSGGQPAYADGLWQLLPRLEAKVRNLVTFQTDREALQFDLGSLFKFTWTRGNTDAIYDPAVFRIEQVSVDPGSLAVEIEAVWVDDITTVNPYLLDDESYTGVVAASGGRTCTVTDGESEVDFSSGDLNSDGVLPGDILILFDTTQADAVFSRYRALRIATVDNTGAFLNVDDPDLDFDTPGGTAVALWVIYRGATTYPDAGSDPTNYPNGSAMYGKVTNSSHAFSDATAGNQLQDG